MICQDSKDILLAWCGEMDYFYEKSLPVQEHIF